MLIFILYVFSCIKQLWNSIGHSVFFSLERQILVGFGKKLNTISYICFSERFSPFTSNIYTGKPNILTIILYSSNKHLKTLPALWNHRRFGFIILFFRRAHLVSHDMGDSILTEILSRHSRQMLPEYFNEFFQSVTFTNGGMIYELINQRLSQVQTNNVIS